MATELDEITRTLDAPTLRYLELVSGLKGKAAVRAWLAYTGFVEVSNPSGKRFRTKQLTVEQRLESARNNAAKYFLKSEEGAIA